MATLLAASSNGAGQSKQPVWFTPGLEIADECTAYWIRQAVLRLRRELCWVWRQGNAPDPVADALQRSRLEEQRQGFFERDETARYLTGMIREAPPAAAPAMARGTFPWLAAECGLPPAEIFTAALALTHSWDAAAAEVIGAAQGDARRSFPTLGLAQRLWDEPGALAGLTSLAHPLFRLGILRAETEDAIDWRTALSMPALVARRLLAAPYRDSAGFRQFRGGAPTAELPAAANLVALRACEPIGGPHAVPLRATSSQAGEAGVADLLESFSAVTGRPVYAWQSVRPGAAMRSAATLCWLDGADLYLRLENLRLETTNPPFSDVPVYVLGFCEQEKLEIPGWQVLPAIDIPSLNSEERLDCWRRAFPDGMAPPEAALAECAFRFRFDAAAIEEIARALLRSGRAVDAESLMAACRQRSTPAPGTLATRVKPRFRSEELILPPSTAAPVRRTGDCHADRGARAYRLGNRPGVG